MKKVTSLLTATLALSGGITLWAGQPVPYASDFYIDYNLDQGWEAKNNLRRGGVSWSPTGVSNDSWLLANGAKGGAKKIYDSNQTQTADSWLISPAVDVKAATEYTVSIYARTTAAGGETECFKITAASSSDMSALKAGTVILDKKDYSNTGEYERLTATFTPEADGEVYFGVQCYSAPEMDHLYLTKFSVTDGEGDGGDQPEIPVEGKRLPYAFDFSDKGAFDTEWKSVAGPGATVTSSVWTYATMGYANWDFTEGVKEDNWLISPPLAVEVAGSYAVDTKVWANGKVEVLIGTDPADLSSFTLVTTFEDNSMPMGDDRPDRTNIDIAQPGSYHLAFRACSEQGTYMGHRVYHAGLKQNLVTPAMVTDLSVTPDPEDGLSVNLSWTYPSQTNTGENLANGEIVKAEVRRGDVVIDTFHYPRPGSSWACVDERITQPGVYAYSVVVYGENGADTDTDPLVVSSGYVGKPVVAFPYDVNIAYDDESAQMFTIEDANADGNGWVHDTSSWTHSFVSTNPGDAEMDDYLSTPYVTLPAGYYLVNFKVGGSNNTYELGYATDRHRQAETFVKVGEVTGDTSSAASDHKLVVVIPQDGDYCFTVRHLGLLADPSAYYKSVTFAGFSIASQTVLPGVATGLKVTAAADNSLAALVEWVNPATDNGCQPLASIAKAVIYRDGEEVATLTQGLLPGERSSYNDTSLPGSGDYLYKVEIYNENGCAEEDAPEMTVFVGPGLQLPYETTDFSGWKSLNLDDDWNEWETGWDDIFGFSNLWGDTPDDYALSPFIELASDHKYRLTVVTHAGGTLEIDLVAGTSQHPDYLAVAGKVTPAEEEKEHVFDFCVPSIDPASDEADTDAGQEENLFPLNPGKNTFGFHASANGKIQIKSFKLVDNGEMSGIETTMVAAVAGLGYANGIIRTTHPATISVYTLDGRLILHATDTDTLPLSGITKGQTVIVTAITPRGDRSTLKINL